MIVYTMDEVAEILKVSTQTVRRLIKDGKLKKVDTSGAVRILKEELDKFLKGE